MSVTAKLHVCFHKAPCEGITAYVLFVSVRQTERGKRHERKWLLNALVYEFILVCGECICLCDLLTIPNNPAQMLSVCVRACVCVCVCVFYLQV